jgi:glycosyltransferase involved in cell wall biosynthesis
MSSVFERSHAIRLNVPTTPIESVVFWHNDPPIHQYALLRALAKSGRLEVVLVTFQDLLPHRRRIGWTEPDFGDVTRVHRPASSTAEALLVKHDSPHSLHVFSGIQAFPPVYAAFRAAIRTKARVGVISLQPDPRGIRGMARLLMYRTHAWRYGKHIDLFLALGENAAEWYRSVGFQSDAVYVFGNFTESPPPPLPRPRYDGDRFALLFVGELIPRKSADVLLRAASRLTASSWRLEIVGDGPMRARLQTLARSLGIDGAVHWSAFQPHDNVFATLSNADILVLPSAFDGWGFVVNEALISGVPVVCSNTCGAAEVVRASDRGSVVRTGDVHALSEALQRQIFLGAPTAAERLRLSEWAGCVSAEAGANYFEAILANAFASGPMPHPPWHAALVAP